MKIAFNPSTVAALTTPPNNKDITFDLRGRNIFARGVKFCGTDTWRDIKINNVSIGSNILDLRNGSNTTLTNTNGVVTINSTWRPVVDNLTSDSTTSSLSANQGRVLAGLINGKSDSGHTHDNRYVKKSGDTMSGVLTIDTTNFGALTIKRNDDANGASIQFRGKSSIYGYIGLNNSTKDKQFLRWSSDTSRTYTILDTSSTYTSNGKGVINGTTITQVDNATNSTNSTNARKLVNWYSARPTSLNTQFGDGSLRIFYATSSTTEGKCPDDATVLHLAWDNNGGWDTQLGINSPSGRVYSRAQSSGTWQPWKTLAFTTDIPSSLKNPHALTISLNGTSQGPYDGSAAKNINITPGSIGAATSDHNHDGRYVRYYAVTTLDCNNLAVGLTAAGVSATNAAHTNHSAFLYISDVGTPFQIQIPDSSVPYIYKRYYGSGGWSGWFKLSAGYADSAGSVAWDNIIGKPSTFNPAAHTHTVFRNNLMIKGTNGVSDSASIHLGIGDSDTGFKWISDGKCQIYANNSAVGEWTSGGMNWFKNPTVNGNKVWNAGNDGSGSGLDADLLDGWHLDSIRKNVGYSWSAKYRINNWSRIIKIDNYSNILLAINFSQNSQASNHLYLISTGYSCGNIVQLGANGYNSNSAIKIRLTENTATSHNVEIYSTYGYNGATELSINCNYTRIDGNSTITTYLTYTAGGGTVRKEITSSYSKIVANLQGNSDTTTKLQTPRQINGTNFDGSANITTSYWGTTRTLTIGNSGKSVNGSANISWSLSEIGAASSSHSHNYAANENYGGFTKSGRLSISGFYQSNESESGGNAPWSGWMHLINCQHSNTGNNYALQIAASFSDNNTFKIRVTNNNVNNAWRDIIHSGNIGNQTVANAYHLRINSANTWSTWYWSGQGGQPSWLWGSNDGTNMYVWNPSNFRVAYASSAGNADTVDGEHASAFTRIVGRNSIGTSGTAPYNYIHLFRIANSNSYSTLDCEIDFRTRYHSAKIEIRIATNNPQYGVGNSSISIVKKVINGRSCNFWVLQTVQSSNYNYYDVYYESGAWNSGSYGIIFKGSNGVLVFEHKGINLTSLPDKVIPVSNNVATSATKLQTPRTIWGQSFDGTGNVDNTLRIRQTTGNYCEGIRIQTADSTWATIILGATGDSGTNANAWSIHRKSDNNFAISRNSSDGTNGLVMTSVGMGLGTTAPTQRLDVHGNIRATGQIIREGSSQIWVNGRRGALLRETTSTVYHTLWSLKTTNGSWDFGEYNSSGWNNIPVLSYITDTNFNSGNNTTTYQIKFPLDSGTIALTKNIPTSLKSPYSLTLKANGTTLAIYDGSSAKEANFTYANVGAASASHSHTYIVAEDLRSKYPGQILDPKRMKLSFLSASTLGIKNDGSYYDVITVRSYVDSSGGSDNALLFSKNSNSLYHTRFAFGSTSSWGSPLLIIDSGNIGSQSVAYASKAGSVAWDNITGKPTIPNPNNYYWANVKISTSSSTTTSPTVSNLTATSSIRMGNIYLQNTNEINSASGIHLNYQNSGNISLCAGGGNVGIGTISPAYKLDVNGQVRASGFHHSSMNSDNYILLAGGGYKSFGGDSNHPVFLGYLNLDHGNDGTVSSSFYCLGYSVPFTYTRGGNYCKISIPDTTHQAFYIKAATASVNYSGGGMDTWTGNNRGAGAWWLHCYAPSSNEVRVKGFHQKDTNNDSWWGGNPLWSDRSGTNRITVCIFGYVTFR